MDSPVTGMREKPLRSASDSAWFEGLVALDEHHVRARHHDLADDRVAELDHRADHLPLARLDLVLGLDVVDQVLDAGAAVQLRVAAMAAERERAGHRVEQARQRAEGGVERAEQAARDGGDPLGALPAHGARPDPDQHVPRDEQQAGRGEEHLPAAAEPVREGERHAGPRPIPRRTP